MREGFSQQELADALGCTQSFISNIERASDPQIPRNRDFYAKVYALTRGEVDANSFIFPDGFPSVDQLALPLKPEPAPLFEAAASADKPQLQDAA